MALTPMTPEQMAQMRLKAEAARKAKYEALAEVKAGTLPIADVLAGAEPRLAKTKVRRVLLELPGVGEVTADQYLRDAGIDPARLVKGLASFPRQRARLAELVTAA